MIRKGEHNMATATEQIVWETSLAEAQEQAKKQGKAVLIDFSAAPE